MHTDRPLYLDSATSFLILLAASLLLLLGVKNIGKRCPKPPGPTAWPVFGNAPSLGATPHLALQKMSRLYGPVFQIKLGSVNAVVLNSYSAIREALCKQKEIFLGRPAFSSYKVVSRGLGVVFSDTRNDRTDWKQCKATIIRHVHMFGTSVKCRERLNSLVTQDILTLAKELEKPHDSDRTLEDTIRITIANTICNICFGKKYDHGNKEFQELLSMNREFGRILQMAPLIDSMPWITRVPFLKFKKAMRDYYKVNTMLDEWTKTRVKDNLEDFDATQVTNIANSMTAEYLKNNTINEKSKLTEDDVDRISALVEDIFGAGQHTVSMAFFWILTYMQVYPNVTNAMKSEIKEVIGDRLPTVADRKKLPSVEAFLHEVLRHASMMAGTIPHCTLGDTDLCGFHIPKGRMVMVDQYSANHDSATWEEPDSFDPSRFLTENEDGMPMINTKTIDKCLIFSIGPRKCPGSELAKMWLNLAIAILVQTCQIRPKDGVLPTLESQYGLVLQPAPLAFDLKINKDYRSMIDNELSK